MKIPYDSSPENWEQYYADLAAMPVPEGLPVPASRGLELQLDLVTHIDWRSPDAVNQLKDYHHTLTAAEAGNLAALDSWVGSNCL